MDTNVIVTGNEVFLGLKKILICNINEPFQQITVKPGLTGCIVLVILFHYFSLTNFFWMLVEGKSKIIEYFHLLVISVST